MQKIKFINDATFLAIDTSRFYNGIEVKFEKDKWYDFRIIYPGIFGGHTSLLTQEGYVINNIGVENICFKIKKVMGAKEFYRDVARDFTTYNNCIVAGNKEWEIKHKDRLEELVKEYLPSGSGFDNGTKFNWKESSDNKLVFDTAFHHMNEGGYYDGWTYHKAIVRPCLSFGFDIKITGRDRNFIKEYIAESFSDFEYAPEVRHYGE